ncbi:MAG: tetratricopeptide repeat protein [Actinomycetota bacterium]
MNDEHQKLEAGIRETQPTTTHQETVAIESETKTWELSYQQGNSLQEKGQFEEAVNAYRHAIKLNPNFFWSYQQLGDAFSKLQQWREAVSAYRHAIELTSDFPWSYNNLGYALLWLAEWEEAIACYYRAIELNINFSWSYYNLGVCLSHKQQWQEAAIAFLQAVQLDPNLPDIYIKLGEALQELHRQTGVEFKIDCDSRLGPLPANSELYFQLGNNLAKDHQLEGAIALYQIAQTLEPNEPKISTQLEQVLRKKYQLEQTIASCRHTVENNPNSSWSYYHLGVALSRQQQWDEAVTAYLRAMELNPDFHWWFYYNIWEALTKQEKLEEAVKLSRYATEVNPQGFWPYLNLGEALTRQGKLDEAIACYQTASYQQALASHPKELGQNQNYLQPVQQPNFIIIGSQRCGTTSLYSYLIKHPEIVSPLKKEIDFWSWHFHRGIDWYLAHFPPLPQGRLFLTGEASPSYFDYREAPERLYNTCSEIKLILLLRNPIDRAISQYHRWVDLNWEYRSFEEAIAEEMERLKKQPENIIEKEPGNYIARGLYIEFIKKWLHLFPREQILILKSEDFYANASTTVKQVLDFLKLPEYQLSEYKNANPGSYSPLSESMRQMLREYFQPYNQELEEYLGLQFNWESKD